MNTKKTFLPLGYSAIAQISWEVKYSYDSQQYERLAQLRRRRPAISDADKAELETLEQARCTAIYSPESIAIVDTGCIVITEVNPSTHIQFKDWTSINKHIEENTKEVEATLKQAYTKDQDDLPF